MNSETIEQCIKKYGNDIYRFCCFLTGTRDLADDLYQDTFVKALEIQRNIAIEDTKNYLIGIAANLWKNQWRKEKKRQNKMAPITYNNDYMLEQTSPNSASHLPNLLDEYIDIETGQMLTNAVNQLPEKYRIIVLMYYSVDLSTKEIAEQLHISKGTVTSRLKRSREKIKKSLEEMGYER